MLRYGLGGAALRKLMGDELFLRTPGGMQPTPFAEQLAESVTYALGMLHSAVNQRTSFDPATSTRSFVIGMTDIEEIHFLSPLMHKLREMAPGVTIGTVRRDSQAQRYRAQDRPYGPAFRRHRPYSAGH